MTRATFLAAAGFLLIVGGCANTPPPQVSANPIVTEKTVLAGNDWLAYWFYDLNADCTPAALPTVKITQAATHGEVAIRSDGQLYPKYPSTNDRHECNKQKSPAVAVIYTADRTYVGMDRFSVKATFAEGIVMERQFLITVSPRVAPSP